MLRRLLKGAALFVALSVAAVPALLSGLEARVSRREDVFGFWADLFSLVPGPPGDFLRRGYYVLTLRRGSLDCTLGFLSRFTHREAEVGPRVYVGRAACLGRVVLGAGALIGARVSVLSGCHQHRFGPDGRLTPCDPDALTEVRVGAESWVGEAAVIMADVGSRCIVAAGSVVATPVPDGCVVAGNPARFAGRAAPLEAAS